MFKKSVFSVICVFFMLVLLPVSYSSLTPETISISLLNQNPDPVINGNIVELRFAVENSGDKAAENFEFELPIKYPLTAIAGEDYTKNIGTVYAQGDHATYVTFKARIASDAYQGTYNIDVRYSYSLIDNPITVQIPINIKTTDSNLIITDLKTTPEIIIPGKPTTLSLKVKNTGNVDIMNAKVKLSLDSTDLSTFNSINEVVVPLIKQGTESTIDFTIIANPKTEANIYKIPIITTYEDPNGNTYEKNYSVGLIVNNEPIIDLLVDSIDTTTDYKINLKFINRGLSDVKFFTAEIDAGKAYYKRNKLYIGTISSDDYESDYFVISKTDFAKTDEDKTNIKMPVKITFYDSLNNEYVMTREIAVNIQEAAQSSGISTTTIIISIIVILGIIYYFKHRRKAKMHYAL